MIRVAIIAPTAFSLYARMVAHWLQRTSGFEWTGVLVREAADLARLRSELRRDGPTLLRKFWRKAILQGDDGTGTNALAEVVAAEGISGTVMEMASRAGARCLVTTRLDSEEAVGHMRAARPDVIAFTGGGLLRGPLLAVAPHGVLNVHMGVLPRYRGMDVVEWPLLEGRPDEVGLTVHRMDSGLDTGPIHRVQLVARHSGETMAALRGRMEVLMVDLMCATLEAIRDGTAAPAAQAPESGRQYFVMHGRLRRLAEDAEARTLRARPPSAGQQAQAAGQARMASAD